MAKVQATEKQLQLIKRPLMTERTTQAGESGWITFEVEKTATKPEIKAALEAIYSVKVERLNTMLVKGKSKRFRGIAGRQSDRKKALVKLAEGQTIDLGLSN